MATKVNSRQITFNSPQGYMLNGKLSVTVASNNLTVAIKTLAGNDASAADPIYIRIGDTVRSITGALSVTKNAGTNWCNSGSAELAAKEIDYFAYLGYNATDGVVLGFSRIPSANRYDDFSATTTNERYCAISTITNAAAGDYYENIGRFAATLSASASYNWSVPTFTAVNLIQRPIFETRVLGWLPTYTGFSSASTTTQEYKLISNMCYVSFLAYGTSNSATFNFTLPFIAAAHSASGSINFIAGVIDNSTDPTNPGIIGLAVGGSASATAKVGKTWSTRGANAYAGFTTSNIKGAESIFFYKF